MTGQCWAGVCPIPQSISHRRRRLAELRSVQTLLFVDGRASGPLDEEVARCTLGAADAGGGLGVFVDGVAGGGAEALDGPR
jgi:hypothetical protein